MARLPALERGVAADRLSRWHSVRGRAVVTLVLVHAWAATQAWGGQAGTGCPSLQCTGRHRMPVAAVHREAPDVVSIVVEGRDLQELQVESGQFFRWRFLTPELWRTAHPFSLSASPSGTHLRLTVKTLGDGSARLQALEPGTWVLAEGPYGAVTAARRTRRNVLLIAGGVGITPMRALFETVPLEPDQDLLLVYRADSEQELLFRDELDAIAAVRGARVRYLPGQDVGPRTPQLFTGSVPDEAERDVYLGGPPGLSRAVRGALLSAGLPEQHLDEERFAF